VISDGGSFGQVSLHTGRDGRAWCCTYPDSAPILNITVASTTVAVCLGGEQVSDEFVAFARELARGAEQFAAEAERLQADQQANGADTAA
jgi:hypothetical protein